MPGTAAPLCVSAYVCARLLWLWWHHRHDHRGKHTHTYAHTRRGTQWTPPGQFAWQCWYVLAHYDHTLRSIYDRSPLIVTNYFWVIFSHSPKAELQEPYISYICMPQHCVCVCVMIPCKNSAIVPSALQGFEINMSLLARTIELCLWLMISTVTHSCIKRSTREDEQESHETSVTFI